MMRQCRVSHHTKCTRHGTQHVSSIWSSNQAPKKNSNLMQFVDCLPGFTSISSMGIKKGSKNGATVSYKTIFCGDIPLHRSYIGLIYMVGTSNLGSWNGHWLLTWLNTEWFQFFWNFSVQNRNFSYWTDWTRSDSRFLVEFQNRNVSRHQDVQPELAFESRFQVAVSTTSMDKASPILPSGKLT